MTKKWFGLIAFATCLVACKNSGTTDAGTTSAATSNSSFSLDAAKQTIDSANLRFADAVRRGDSAMLGGYYHSDALFMLPNYEPIAKANIAATMGGMIRMGIKDTKLSTTDLVGNEDLLLETGTYEMYGDNKMVIDKGKYLMAWKKEDGQWKIYRDIINTNLPMRQGH